MRVCIVVVEFNSLGPTEDSGKRNTSIGKHLEQSSLTKEMTSSKWRYAHTFTSRDIRAHITNREPRGSSVSGARH